MSWDRLSPQVRSDLGSFQRYIAERSLARAQHWVSSRPLIQRVATSIAESLREPKPPTSLGDVAELLGIEVRCVPAMSARHFGKLAPAPGGFIATVYGQIRTGSDAQGEFILPNLGPARPGWLHLNRRGRFTLAHEFGHALFYNFMTPGTSPSRIIPRRNLSRNDVWREEGLCDAFARALLIPERTQSIVDKNFSFAVLIESAKCFGVPGEILMHRVMHDWMMWGSRMIFRIEVRSGEKHVRLFRGRSRPTDESGPTKGRIASLITDCGDAEGVADLLRKTLRLTNRKVLVHRDVVWVDY